MPTFSVIIPTYNRAKDIDQCLSSLVSQNYTDFEVIVCDDGSTDNTKDIVESYKDKLNIKYDWAENWGGPARPRNRGLKLSQADWICFLDSDDWWYSNKLEECWKHLDSSDVIYHDLDVYIDPAEKPIFCLHSRKLAGDIFTDLMVNNNALFNSSVVIRKSILDKIGGISEDKELISIEDLDCWLRISKITNRFSYIPKAFGAYRLETNISRTIKHAHSLEFLWRKHMGDLKTDKDKKFVTKTLRYNQARIYHMNKKYGQALSYYWQAGLSIPLSRALKYLNNKIRGYK